MQPLSRAWDVDVAGNQATSAARLPTTLAVAVGNTGLSSLDEDLQRETAVVVTESSALLRNTDGLAIVMAVIKRRTAGYVPSQDRLGESGLSHWWQIADHVLLS